VKAVNTNDGRALLSSFGKAVSGGKIGIMVEDDNLAGVPRYKISKNKNGISVKLKGSEMLEHNGFNFDQKTTDGKELTEGEWIEYTKSQTSNNINLRNYISSTYQDMIVEQTILSRENGVAFEKPAFVDALNRIKYNDLDYYEPTKDGLIYSLKIPSNSKK